MAEQELVQIPNPLLRRVAAPAGEPDPDLAAELVDALQVEPGAVGLAAPQLGISVRVVCVDVSAHHVVQRHGLPHHGLVVLFDPLLVQAEGTALQREGCPSVPDFCADVRRAQRVVVRGTEPGGQPQVLHAEGFEARALQHQLDHLDGRLILDRVAGARAPAAAPRGYAVDAAGADRPPAP